VAVFYPFGHPTLYVYAFKSINFLVKQQLTSAALDPWVYFMGVPEVPGV
jgi:hypothetical protein